MTNQGPYDGCGAGYLLLMSLLVGDGWYVSNRLSHAGAFMPDHFVGPFYVIALFLVVVGSHMWLINRLWRVRGRVGSFSAHESIVALGLAVGLGCVYLPTAFWLAWAG